MALAPSAQVDAQPREKRGPAKAPGVLQVLVLARATAGLEDPTAAKPETFGELLLINLTSFGGISDHAACSGIHEQC